jgi:predicted signal transduction protein with EAL and GGDEF domain
MRHFQRRAFCRRRVRHPASQRSADRSSTFRFSAAALTNLFRTLAIAHACYFARPPSARPLSACHGSKASIAFSGGLKSKAENWWNGGIRLLHDFTAQYIVDENLPQIALTDALTGLWNRRQFFAAGKAMLAEPVAREPIATLMLDIDCLKAINDRVFLDFLAATAAE